MLIKRFTETAVLPRRATEGSAGYDLSADLSQPEVTAIADIKEGNEEAAAWGCDLTYDYVKINGDYRT